jgi:hypothetical protein
MKRGVLSVLLEHQLHVTHIGAFAERRRLRFSFFPLAKDEFAGPVAQVVRAHA